MNTTIEQLQHIVKDNKRGEQERTEAAQLIVKLTSERTEIDVEADQIPDDDPEVLKILEPCSDPEIEAFIGSLPYCARTLPEVKRCVARERRAARLRAIAGDVNKAMDERVKAALQWRADIPKDDRWHRYSETELVERLTVHPHYQRLNELSRIMRDQQETIRARFAAIDEYRRLRDEFPRHEVPQDAYEMLDWGYNDVIARNLAHEVGREVATKTGASSSYVAELVFTSRGADYDVPLADICAEIAPQNDATEAPKRAEINTEMVLRHYEIQLAKLSEEQSNIRSN